MTDFTAFGPAGAVAIVVWLFLRNMKEERQFRADATDKMTKSINHNTKVSKQTYDLLKNLNGELKKAAQKKLEA